MNAVHVPSKIFFIPDSVLQVPPLPDAARALPSRLKQRLSRESMRLENADLINIHRVENAASPDGSVQVAR